MRHYGEQSTTFCRLARTTLRIVVWIVVSFTVVFGDPLVIIVQSCTTFWPLGVRTPLRVQPGFSPLMSDLRERLGREGGDEREGKKIEEKSLLGSLPRR